MDFDGRETSNSKSHTLHRSGSVDSLKNDFPILAIGAKGYNRDCCAKELVKIGEIFLKHNVVNAGILGMDGPLTMERVDEALKVVSDNGVTHAVFRSEEDLVACLKAVSYTHLRAHET